MNIQFTKLTRPTAEITEAFNRWENDPKLVPIATRPNMSREDLEIHQEVTFDDIIKRSKHHQIYLIHLDGQLVGEMDYQVDPGHLFKKETGTAWIGIVIGEEAGRGKGVGGQAMLFLEEQIKGQGLKRIELGVFEFNISAIKLYKKLGFMEIGRIKDFTYWDEKMWQDIRMEKYIK